MLSGAAKLVIGLGIGAAAIAVLSRPNAASEAEPNKPRTATPAERNAVLDVFEARGYPRAEANKVVSVESGWRPGAINRARDGTILAVGLIQFIPSTLKRLGYQGTPESFARLSATAQLPWIDKFLAGQKRWRVPGDTYLTLAAPDFVGAPDETIVYDVGTRAWELNPGLRSANNGPITAGSIRAVIL